MWYLIFLASGKTSGDLAIGSSHIVSAMVKAGWSLPDGMCSRVTAALVHRFLTPSTSLQLACPVGSISTGAHDKWQGP